MRWYIVELRATPGVPDYFGTIGTGVWVDNIRRVQDQFIEAAILRETPLLGRYEARSAAQ